MSHERRDGDDRAADGAYHSATEKPHKKSTFDRKVGELVSPADQAKGDADDESGRHEQHQLQFLVRIAFFGEEDPAKGVPASKQRRNG